MTELDLINEKLINELEEVVKLQKEYILHLKKNIEKKTEVLHELGYIDGDNKVIHCKKCGEVIGTLDETYIGNSDSDKLVSVTNR